MMVCCGYEWIGYLVMVDGQIYILYGKVGNMFVLQVEVDVVDVVLYEICICGLIKESMFKKVDLQMMIELCYVLGSNQFSLYDVLINYVDYFYDYQIIYYSNFGMLIFEEGVCFFVLVVSIGFFNDYVKVGLDNW